MPWEDTTPTLTVEEKQERLSDSDSLALVAISCDVDLQAAIPKHIAIIMDGNRRWAKKLHLLPVMGHYYGADVLQDTVEFAAKIGVQVLTAYAFSTENWRREPQEVEALLQLFARVLQDKRTRMIDNGIRLCTIGNIAGLPDYLQQVIADSKEATKECQKIDLVLALNYGGRDDIRRAAVQLIQEATSGKITQEQITEHRIAKYLDTAQWRDPELLIRTSGEMRLSNFLLWQLSYSELYMTDTLWPDFRQEHLMQAIASYQKRHLRHGK